MKKVLILIAVLLMATLFVGCDWLPFVPESVPAETLSADVGIINWVQDDGEIALTYELTNTGTVGIAYYKILFEVTYEDGSKYIIWHEKIGIPFAGSDIVEVIIEVSDEVARVDIMDLKLTEWKF